MMQLLQTEMIKKKMRRTNGSIEKKETHINLYGT